MGDMLMTYNLAGRSGRIDITDFGEQGRDFGGDLWGEQTGSQFHGEDGAHDDVDFAAEGNFVNDGANKGAGVIGNFAAQGGDWSAGGVFAGTYQGPAPTPN